MNSLSWFIYLTQIVDNLGNAAGGVLAAVGIFGGIGLVMFSVFTFEIGNPTDDNERYLIGLRKTLTKAFVAIMVVAGLVAVFTPSRQTMLMIAGSEMGERLIKSESVNGIVNPGMDLIRKWIKQEADKIEDHGE